VHVCPRRRAQTDVCYSSATKAYRHASSQNCKQSLAARWFPILDRLQSSAISGLLYRSFG